MHVASERFESVTVSNLPLSWFVCVSESPSELLGGYWLTFLPFRPWFPWTLGFSKLRPLGFCRRNPSLSSPTLSLHLSGLLQCSVFRFGFDADSEPKMEALASLPVPSASFRSMHPFFHPHSVRTFDHRYRGDQRSRSQGLATLSTMLASSIPGSLFQLPTLMGFTLQSFSPRT